MTAHPADMHEGSRFSTGKLPPGRRLDALRSTLDHLVLPGALSARRQPSAEISVVTAGDSWAMALVSCEGIRVTHGATHLGNANASSLLVWVQTGGEAEFTQSRQRIRCQSGQIVVRDAAQPSAVDIPTFANGIILRLAKCGRLQAAARLLDGRPARLRDDSGPAIMLRGFLMSLVDRRQGPADALFCRARNTLSDLLSDALSQVEATQGAGGTLDAVFRAIHKRAREPNLRIADIAEESGINQRRLNQLLAGRGLNYRQAVREVRLEMARAALKQGSSVTAACFQSGFNDTAHFSRAFRTRYGTSPRAFRARVLGKGCHRP